MELDLLVRNATLPDGRAGVDIACAGGSIASTCCSSTPSPARIARVSAPSPATRRGKAPSRAMRKAAPGTGTGDPPPASSTKAIAVVASATSSS